MGLRAGIYLIAGDSRDHDADAAAAQGGMDLALAAGVHRRDRPPGSTSSPICSRTRSTRSTTRSCRSSAPGSGEFLRSSRCRSRSNWDAIFVFVGTFTGLIYFFFSVEHKKAAGGAARIGIFFLMVTFGASFGYTVMSRMSLLIGRMDFLFGDWLGLLR